MLLPRALSIAAKFGAVYWPQVMKEIPRFLFAGNPVRISILPASMRPQCLGVCDACQEAFDGGSRFQMR